MKFSEFKAKTKRFNILNGADIAGSFDFFTTIVSLESLTKDDFQEVTSLLSQATPTHFPNITPDQYRSISRLLPLATHEFTHFVDGTSTLWGLNHLKKMNHAYLCDDRRQSNEYKFFAAKEFLDHVRSIRLPEYYTYSTNATNTRPWQADISIGKLFGSNGQPTDRSILFQRFSNFEGKLLVRSPISEISILEASAMAQELQVSLFLVRRLTGDFGIVETKDFSVKMLDYLYNIKLTEYSVCVHLIANKIGTPDGVVAFAVCAILTRLVLNFPPQAYEMLLATPDLMDRIGLPGDHPFSEAVLNGLSHKDMGAVFFLFSRCLPRQPEMLPSDASKAVEEASSRLGINLDDIHNISEQDASKINSELASSDIPTIRLLGQIGVENKKILSRKNERIDFHSLNLPKVLLGDSTQINIFGNPNSSLASVDLDEIFEPLFAGQRWVERFSEACV